MRTLAIRQWAFISIYSRAIGAQAKVYMLVLGKSGLKEESENGRIFAKLKISCPKENTTAAYTHLYQAFKIFYFVINPFFVIEII